MNYPELRQYLATFEDTPENRTELRRMLIAGNADEIMWGYAEHNAKGFLKWYENWKASLQEALERHRSGEKELTLKDLAGADLSGEDLSHADLSHADLSGAKLSHADLSGADLSEVNLAGADLSEADLSGANLRDAELSNANLRNADLSHANLRWASLSFANLEDADLEGATYNPSTEFPEDFSPESAGMNFVKWGLY